MYTCALLTNSWLPAFAGLSGWIDDLRLTAYFCHKSVVDIDDLKLELVFVHEKYPSVKVKHRIQQETIRTKVSPRNVKCKLNESQMINAVCKHKITSADSKLKMKYTLLCSQPVNWYRWESKGSHTAQFKCGSKYFLKSWSTNNWWFTGQ